MNWWPTVNYCEVIFYSMTNNAVCRSFLFTVLQNSTQTSRRPDALQVFAEALRTWRGKRENTNSLAEALGTAMESSVSDMQAVGRIPFIETTVRHTVVHHICI